MKKRILVICAFFATHNLLGQPDYASFVNPFIGTGGHGHTFPGATVPFGMVQLSPDTRIDGSWDGCSGYHHSDSVVYGFSHTHLSGTGCSDYGDFLLMPMSGPFSFNPSTYASKFSHANEKATAGFYSAHLDDHNIDVELTSTTRVGFHKYIYRQGGISNVILDLEHRDKLIEGEIKIVNSRTVNVYRRSDAWARDQRIYAVIVFSKPFTDTTLQQNKKAAFIFDMKKDEPLLIKVAISAVDYDGAMNNLKTELDGWDFNATKKNAHAMWNHELKKVEVQDDDKNKLTIFYTALYHCFIQPNIYSDCDGRYRGRDLQIHKADFDYYTVFSLWDTFRAWHPLMTLINEKRTVDFIKTFLAQFEQGGLLPVWELSSNETECMIGYHGVSVIADAMMKGINGFDYEKVYAACKKSAEARNRYGLGTYIDKGFLELEDENESVSKTLEYAYDDWCIAQMAKKLEKIDDAAIYTKRSESWKNLLDTKTGFMRARSNGGWLTPFDPYEVNNNFTEANSWQYTFFVPHQIEEMIQLHGGKEKFEMMLDNLFSAKTKTSGREQADITGLIGQYAHGNEPSHHMAYLYHYVGKDYKTQKLIHTIVNDFYKNTEDGLIGNEDCGQMSAWYILSSLGFYNVCPATETDQYILGTPGFQNAVVHFENGNQLAINTTGFSKKNFYVNSVTNDNGSNFKCYSLNHSEIKNGMSITFNMSNKPYYENNYSENQGLNKSEFVVVPSFSSSGLTFKDTMHITIESLQPGCKIYYMIQGAFERPEKKEYTKPFIIDTTSIIYAYCVNNAGAESKLITARYYKLLHPEWSVKLNSTYTPQYSAGGDGALIDGLHGDENWRKGRWHGYQSQDFECIIDMQYQKNISNCTAGFLQDSRAWILMPLNMSVEISADGTNFISVGTVTNIIKADDTTPQVKNFSLTFDKVSARYVKVKAKNYGKLPEWHQGFPFNGDAYIFIDEIDIR